MYITLVHTIVPIQLVHESLFRSVAHLPTGICSDLWRRKPSGVHCRVHQRSDPTFFLHRKVHTFPLPPLDLIQIPCMCSFGLTSLTFFNALFTRWLICLLVYVTCLHLAFSCCSVRCLHFRKWMFVKYFDCVSLCICTGTRCSPVSWMVSVHPATGTSAWRWRRHSGDKDGAFWACLWTRRWRACISNSWQRLPVSQSLASPSRECICKIWDFWPFCPLTFFS